MLRLCLTLLFLALLLHAEANSKTVEAKYMGSIQGTVGVGAILSEISPLSRFYVCFQAGNDLLIGEMMSWTWNDLFRGVSMRETMKIRYDDKHIWAHWPKGKEIRFSREFSEPRAAEHCQAMIKLFGSN